MAKTEEPLLGFPFNEMPTQQQQQQHTFSFDFSVQRPKYWEGLYSL